MNKQEEIELENGIAILLEEPDIQFIDWSMGHWLLQNHKAALPHAIISYLRSRGELESLIEE